MHIAHNLPLLCARFCDIRFLCRNLANSCVTRALGARSGGASGPLHTCGPLLGIVCLPRVSCVFLTHIYGSFICYCSYVIQLL